MKLDTVKPLNESAADSVNLKNKNDIKKISELVAAQGYPTSFNVLCSTSEGDLNLSFDLKGKSIDDEDALEHVVKFDYRLSKKSYAKVQAMQAKLKNVPESEDPDGEKYDAFVSETSFDGFYMYGEFTGKPSRNWGVLD